jgi:purine nucleosidase
MKQVYFDNDAAVDDLLSVIFLLGMPEVEVLGIGVTPADCYLDTGLAATLKILQLLGRAHIPVAGGTLAGRHPFPHAWRVHSDQVNALPILNQHPHPDPEPVPAHQQLIQKVRAAPAPVTLLFTGPLTHLAAALDLEPAIESKIERLYFMGGAIDVPGNVYPPHGEGDGSAEWNVYWDSVSAARVWASAIPITLIGLDATDKVPLTEAFLERLGQQRQYRLSDLAYQCWAYALGTDYYLWDTLTTLTLAYPDLVTVRDVPCAIAVDGPQDGRTFRSPNARSVQVGVDLDPGRVYQTVLDLLRQ